MKEIPHQDFKIMNVYVSNNMALNHMTNFNNNDG